MPAAQPQLAGSEGIRTATVLVLNSNDQIRELVETAVRAYPLHKSVRLVFETDLTKLASTPRPDVVLVNLAAPAETCFRLIPMLRQQWPRTRLIILAESDDIHLWADLIRVGAYELLPRSIEWRQLGWVLQGALWNSPWW
jgi:DNA-binding NarL/FixJ family response regulator